MARRRQRERTESLKEEKEEERKGQVLNGERERERESHMCKKDCFRKTATVWPCGRDEVSNFSIFLLCTSKLWMC